MYAQMVEYKLYREPKQTATHPHNIKDLPLKIELAMFNTKDRKKQIFQNARRRGWLDKKPSRTY